MASDLPVSLPSAASLIRQFVEVSEEESTSRNAGDYLGYLPNEILRHLLSYLSFEEIDNLRLVNQKFKNVCNYILMKNHRYVKQQVALCSEKAHLIEDFDIVTSSSRIFWFAVSEFLDNSFCLFDPLKGYLDKKYSVNGKTLDVVHQILWLKEHEDPLPLLAEMIIGRSERHSNMKNFEDFETAYFKWCFVKKFRGQIIEEIYLPLIQKIQHGLNLPRYALPSTLRKEHYGMVLDMLTIMWTEEINIKQHRVVTSQWFDALARDDDLKMITVSKFDQNANSELYQDSDSDLYLSDEATTDDDDDFYHLQRINDSGYKTNYELDCALENL